MESASPPFLIQKGIRNKSFGTQEDRKSEGTMKATENTKGTGKKDAAVTLYVIFAHLVAKHIPKVSPIREFLISIFNISFCDHAVLSSHPCDRVLMR
jgi:hypothetical protein